MSWGTLLLVFLRAAFLSINGSTTLALLKDDLVDRLHVLSPQDFATGVVIGSASPGPLGYGCIALGFLADGWRGALVAAFTSWMPAFLAVPLRAWQRKLADRPWVAGLTWGVGAAGTGLLLAMVAALLKSSVHDWRDVLIAAGVLVLLFRRVPMWAVLAIAAAAGAVFLHT